MGAVLLQKAGHLLRVPGCDGQVAGFQEGVAHLAQGLRVGVHHQDPRSLPRRFRCRREVDTGCAGTTPCTAAFAGGSIGSGSGSRGTTGRGLGGGRQRGDPDRVSGAEPDQRGEVHVQGAETFDDPPRLPVERHGPAGPGVDHHPDRRGFDQGLQVGPGPLLVPVRTGVGDGGGRLRGEQLQDLFVLAAELASPFLVAEEEAAHVHLPMPHRRALESPRPQRHRG